MTNKMCLEKIHSRKNNKLIAQLINTVNLTCTLTHHLLSPALHQGADGDSSQALLANYFHFALSLINKTPQWQNLLVLLSKEEVSKEALPRREASNRKPWTAETFWLPNNICTFSFSCSNAPPPYPGYSWFLLYFVYTSNTCKSTQTSYWTDLLFFSPMSQMS